MKQIRICILSAVLYLIFGTAVYAESISGQVFDAAYGPENVKILSGVKVYAYGEQNNAVVTDQAGKYTLENVQNADFLVFERNGYVKAMKKINGSTLDMAMVCEGLTTISDTAFFGEYINLDYPGLEKVKKAWVAGDVLMAKYELIEYYRNRETPKWNVKPVRDENWKPNPSYSLIQPNEEYKHIYKGYDINTPEKTINWRADPYNDSEFKWEVNRMFAPLHMGKAYDATHDSKYAYEYQAECIDWIKQNPKPMWKDRSDTWRTIEAGIRNHYPLPDSWYYTLFNEDITTEGRITMLKSVVEHMEYLTAYTGTNNWLIFESRGLYTLATLHPYFKNSSMWKEIGITRANAQLQNQFAPDGWHQEQTPNYHMESANSLTEIENIAHLNNEQTVMSEGLRGAYAVENYCTFAGGRAIPLNDTHYSSDFRGLIRGRAKVVSSYETRAGAEYLFTASDYRVGEAPKETSKAFDYAGLSVMRDYWGPNNIMVYFEGGPAGMGHGMQSRDKLQVMMSAYGRDMLIEGGCLDYTSTPIAKYFYTSTPHNVALVDGQDQIRRKSGMREPAENFVAYMSDDFDYTTGLYDETFGEGAMIPVNQKRKVAFDKDGIVFVTDEFTGEGSHSVTWNWNITQCKYTLNGSTGKFVGTYDDGTGLVMLPLDGHTLKADVAEGQMTESDFRGLISIDGVSSCTGLQYNLEQSELPLNMNLLILPFQGEAPDVKVQKQETADGLSCIQIKYDDTLLYYLTNHGSQNHDYGKFVFDGETAVIRCDAMGNITDVKKYPETAAVSYNGQIVETGAVTISTIKSGDILHDSVKLAVEGVSAGTVTYYAELQGETRQIASGAPESEQTWDLSDMENMDGVRLWAEWTDGKNVRKSRILRDIGISNSIDISTKISLADRRFRHDGNSVTLYDGGALYASGVVCAAGDSVSGKIRSDKSALIKISARVYEGKDAVVRVTINGESKEILLNQAYSEYEVGRADGDYSFTIENPSESKVILNYLRNEGEGILRENNKVFRNSMNVANSTCSVGQEDWADYEMSAKLMISNVYSKKDSGFAGLTAHKGAVQCRVNSRTDKIELVSVLGNETTVLDAADFDVQENVWYNVKMKISGGEVTAKLWRTGTEEPAQYIVRGIGEKSESGVAGLIASDVDSSVDDIVIRDSSGSILYENDMENDLCGALASKFSGSVLWGVSDKWIL